MSIDSETLIKIKELSDKKDKTKRQEEKLKNLKEFLLKDKKKKEKGIPKIETLELPNYSDFIRKKEKRKDFKIPLEKDYDNLLLTPEMMKGGIGPMKKGGEVKGYHKGGPVHKKKNTMATTKGWGISRKT